MLLPNDVRLERTSFGPGGTGAGGATLAEQVGVRTRTDDAAAADGSRAARTSARVAARQAATRELILEAAWELAHERGLTGFTLRELASQVGMRAPSLYGYFASKDAIYDAMFAQGNRAFLAAARALPTAGAGRREVLVAAARAFLGFATEDPVRFQLLFQRSIVDWDPSPEAYAPAVEAYGLMRERFAELGITDQGSLDLWTALTSGLAHQQVANDPGGHRWHDLVEETVDLFLLHLEGSHPDGHR
jgi:AcrR family transcriptional regulator